MNIDVNQCMANNNGFKCSRERVSITPIKDNILLCQSQDKEIFCL